VSGGRACAALLTVGCGLLAACASSSRRAADRLLAAGETERAADAYRALLDDPPALERRDSLLFRAATAQALLELESGEPAKSHALLEELVTGHPESEHRPAAQLLLGLLDEIETQGRGLATARRATDRARADAEVQAELLAKLRREVEMLKAIDLDRTRVPAKPPPG